MKKILTMACLSALCLLLLVPTGCDKKGGGEETEGSTAATAPAETTAAPETTPEVTTTAKPADYTEKKLTFEELAGKYKLNGRSAPVKTGISFDWSGEGIEFNLDCRGDVILNAMCTNKGVLVVYIDGVACETKFDLPVSVKTDLVIAKDLEAGPHNFRVYKDSLVAYGNTAMLINLYSLTFTGEVLEAPAEKDLYIEFIGDSITGGSGILGATGTTANAAELAVGTQSYGFLTAQALDADYSIFAIGGSGFVKSYNKAIVPKIYDYVSWFRNKTDMYSFERKPDVVVMQLGINDKGLGTTTEEFLAAAEAFVLEIKEKSGNAPLVWAYGMMSDNFVKESLEIVEKLGGESAGIYTLRLPKGTSAAGGHPNAAEHKAAAEVLTEYLKTIIKEK